MVPIEELLAKVVSLRGSDLHLKAGSPPAIRIDGELRPADLPILSAEDTEAYAQALLTREASDEFEETGDADFAWGRNDLGRFRINVYRQRGSVGLAIRWVLPASKNFEELGLPRVMAKLADEQRGLVLITGPTGSGKSTSLAAMVDHINSTRRATIVTIEDPIEVLHTDKLSMVAQREVGIDTADFSEALRRVLRQDPNVILIGEMRDADTVRAALKAAETGHLVLSSLHTIDATETMNRIVDFFPPYQQRQVRLQLAGMLRGVVSQRLLERADGRGRVPATEVLIMNGRVFDRIVDEAATHTLTEVIREGEFYGMHTFDQSIFELYHRELISFQEAQKHATNPHDLKVRIEQAGLLSA